MGRYSIFGSRHAGPMVNHLRMMWHCSGMASERRNLMTTAALRLTHSEKAQLQAEADAEGITISVLLYRRAFGVPDANHARGRVPGAQQEALFQMTG